MKPKLLILTTACMLCTGWTECSDETIIQATGNVTSDVGPVLCAVGAAFANNARFVCDGFSACDIQDDGGNHQFDEYEVAIKNHSVYQGAHKATVCYLTPEDKHLPPNQVEQACVDLAPVQWSVTSSTDWVYYFPDPNQPAGCEVRRTYSDPQTTFYRVTTWYY